MTNDEDIEKFLKRNKLNDRCPRCDREAFNVRLYWIECPPTETHKRASVGVYTCEHCEREANNDYSNLTHNKITPEPKS